MTDPAQPEDPPRTRRDAAIRALVDRDINQAADLYALAGRGTLAGLECEGEGRALLGSDAEWAGYGLAYLWLSALAARITGRNEQATARASEGIAIATDYREREPALVFRACLEEFRGDFAVVGDIGVDAYDRALEIYDRLAVSDPVSVATRPLFEGGRLGVQQAGRNTVHQFSWDDLHGSTPDGAGYLAHRVRFKRSRIPRIIDAVIDRGTVAPPRGTTEHNNADWRCPECGGSEVNWTAGEILCLDCDVRMRPK